MSLQHDWHVYVMRCADGSLYTGIARDVARRVAAHAAGTSGAKYVRGRAPFTLEFQHAVGDRSVATAIERHIKGWAKAKKERMLRAPGEFRALLDARIGANVVARSLPE